MRQALLSLLMLAGAAAPAAAAVTIRDAVWEVALQVKNKRRHFHKLERWMLPPSPAVKMRPRVIVELDNTGSKPASALLLRYSFSARLRRIGRPKTEAVWTVPFEVEERRVPRVGGGERHRVALHMNRVMLRSYLKRMYHAGYWPTAFRVQIMVEPRPGETFAGRIVERELPVLWKTGGKIP